jgi:hypothetical protein
MTGDDVIAAVFAAAFILLVAGAGVTLAALLVS